MLGNLLSTVTLPSLVLNPCYQEGSLFDDLLRTVMLSSTVTLGSKDGALRPSLQPHISLSEGTASATQQDIARLI